ncbi:MAG: VWA domain-containing protein [Sedimentisphaerales bacterium]|nr:VWA domain-containing protein [Sedimentisphaerales bacterium]
MNVLGRLIFAIILVCVFFAVFKNNRQRSAVQVTHEQPPVVHREPVRNPIMRALTESSAAAQREGIAIGVAFDVSGSMKDNVVGVGGKMMPKIQVARQCALDILKQADAFVQKHPEQPVEVGVFEFSSRHRQPSCRQVIPFGPINLSAATAAVSRMVPDGGTPIGDAVIHVKQAMDRAGLKTKHLLVITDGENNQGYAPGDVVDVLSRLPDDRRSSVYFFAFDVAANKFNAVRDAGGLILSAANGTELQQTLDYVLMGKILVEQPETPGAN